MLFKELIKSIGTLSFLFLIGCIPSAITDAEADAKKAVDTFDEAIKIESPNWRKVLEETRDKLTNETQSTVRNEVQELINNGIAATGGEYRCNSDFVKNRLNQELIHIRNKLASKINIPALPEESLDPQICQAIPSAIDLSLVPSRLTELKLFGYDFSKEKIQVFLSNKNSDIDINISEKLTQPSQYLLSLNLSQVNGVIFSEKSNKIIIKSIKDNKQIYDLNISQPSFKKEDFIHVYRWFQPSEKDWITLAEDEIPDVKLYEWGYSAKSLQFYALKERKPNTISVYRWGNKAIGDFMTIGDGEISDEEMSRTGYGEKRGPQFYVFKDQQPNTVPVYRWWHPGDSDSISLREGEISEANLRAWGYQNKTLQFYVFREIPPNIR